MSRRSQSALPDNWEERVDAKGRVYYVDHTTETTHWKPPAPMSVPKPQEAPKRTTHISGVLSKKEKSAIGGLKWKEKWVNCEAGGIPSQSSLCELPLPQRATMTVAAVVMMVAAWTRTMLTTTKMMPAWL